MRQIQKPLHEILQGIFLLYQTQCLQLNFSLLNEYLYADKERISQVLINLINNAAKYSNDGKDIIIRSQKKDRFIVISVQDFGIGISKRNQSNVFERFYQTDQSTTYPGLGLGLYIAKEIVRENGGQIWVKSKIGKGSTFCFSLPIAVKSNTSTNLTIKKYS